MSPSTAISDTIGSSLRWIVIAMLCIFGLVSSPYVQAQDSQQPLGKEVSRTALQISNRLSNFQYHAKTDSWYPRGDGLPDGMDAKILRPRKSGPRDFVDFDPKVWRLIGEAQSAYFDNVGQTKVDSQFVCLVRTSATHREARIYAQRSEQGVFEFVCRGSQPSSGIRNFAQTESDIRFCFLDRAVAFVWDNSAVTAIDSEVDSIVWTDDQRHIVYARRRGDGHQLIAYSIAEDDYSVLGFLPKSPTIPLLFPNASDGVFVVTTGTDIRNVSLPPTAVLPKFESLRQIPLLYRSVDHRILSVREVEGADDRSAGNRLLELAERSTQNASVFKVRISVLGQ